VNAGRRGQYRRSRHKGLLCLLSPAESGGLALTLAGLRRAPGQRPRRRTRKQGDAW